MIGESVNLSARSHTPKVLTNCRDGAANRVAHERTYDQIQSRHHITSGQARHSCEDQDRRVADEAE
jgi:hypothetical protein